MDATNDLPEFPSDFAYKFSKKIGTGSFGKVFEAEHRIVNAKVAIKQSEKDCLEDFCQELVSLQKLSHHNIVGYFHVFSTEIHYFLVMEIAPGRDLYTYVTDNDIKLEEHSCRIVGRQLASALCYMHNKQIVHRDIKLENVMYDESSMHVKIIDFGLSGILDSSNLLTKFCGTAGYIAPEIFREQPYDGRVDMWSLGILLYELLTGILPDIIPVRKNIFKTRVANNIEEVVKTHLQLDNIRTSSTHFQNMLAGLLQPDPSNRLDSLRLCQHPWLTENFTNPIPTYGYESLPTAQQFQIYKQLAVLTNNTLGDTVNLVETTDNGHFAGMYRMLSRPDLEKLYLQKCARKSEEKKVLDDCNHYPKRRLRLNSVQAEMLH